MKVFIQKLKIVLNSRTFIISILLITFFTVLYKVNNIKSKYDENTNEIIGTILEIKEDDLKTTLIVKAKENLIVYYKGNNKFNLGDRVLINGKLEQLKNNTIFNLFNYRKYMLSKNIYYSVTTSNIKPIKSNKNIFFNIKTFLINRINSIKRSEYLKAFILGNDDYISDSIVDTYRINGISHLFCVSGMHIGLLSSILFLILNKIKKHIINYFYVIVFLLFYMFLTNFTPSVLRATLFFILITINKLLNLRVSTIKILVFVLCINLIVNPYNIYNIGFKFSYIISFYLVLFKSIINRHKNYFLKIFITSFISFLVSIPIMIDNYFSINLLSIFYNIIFVPLVSLIIFPFSLLTLFIKKLGFIYEMFISLLEKLSIFLSNFKIELILPKTNIFIIVLYYLIITFILYKLSKKKYRYILIIIVVIIFHTNYNYFNNELYITYIDVNQGDSILIRFPYNEANILIDTGAIYNYNLEKSLINYFKSKGISKIDYLIITHGDYDHMGEAINLVNNFKVEKVIFNCGPYNDLEKELIKVLDKKKIKYYSCIEELNIDKNKLYFLQTKEYDNENDNSNVIYTELNGYKFMFMGDASITTEKEILDKYNLPDIDVLKVGHHGSKTSSSENFINEINPKYSIISVGKNNRYGHPNKEVLNNLEGSKIYRTDKDGSIMFAIKNNKLKIDTCRP